MGGNGGGREGRKGGKKEEMCTWIIEEGGKGWREGRERGRKEGRKKGWMDRWKNLLRLNGKKIKNRDESLIKI